MLLSYAHQVTLRGVGLYLAEHRALHRVFQEYNLPNAHHLLDEDLVALEIAVGTPDMPPLVPEPYISEYAVYVSTLPFHRMLAHWFVMSYVHMMIPDAGSLIRSSVLPDGWSSGYLSRDDDLLVRRSHEDSLRSFMPLESSEFTEELAEVYIRLLCIVSLLFKKM